MRTAWMVVVAALAAGSTARAADECKQFENGNGPEWYEHAAILTMSGCREVQTKPAGEGAYWLDTPGRRTSEIARVYHVWTCYGGDDRDAALTCGIDATRLNRAVFDAEVAKLPLTVERKANFKRYFDEAEVRVNKSKKTLDWAFKQQPASKQVLAAAEQGFKDWDAFYQRNRAAIDAAVAVEDKWWKLDPRNHPDAVADLGCGGVREAWHQWIVDKKITRAKDIPGLVGHDELGVIVLRALALCDGTGGKQADAVSEAEVLQKSFPFRGPRMHAVWAAMEATTKLIPESESPIFVPAQIEDSLLQAAANRAEYNYRADAWDQLEQGMIAKIAKVADGYSLTFKKQKWMEPDFECKDLPTRWWSNVDGQWKHDFACKQVGSHPESSQLDPRIVSAETGGGLKPGQVITLRSGKYSGKDGVYAFVMESRTPAKWAKLTKRKVSTQRGADLSVAGTLNVVYGVALR